MKQNKPLVYIYPSTSLESDILNALSEVGPTVSEEAAPARGGYDFTPSLHVSLKFVGEVAIMWILAGVGTDAYKALKSGIKKLVRIEPPRPTDWPKNIPDPKFIGLIIHVEVASHLFIIDFDFDDEESLLNALDSLPNFLSSLSENSNPTHHLLLWKKDRWVVTLSHSLSN